MWISAALTTRIVKSQTMNRLIAKDSLNYLLAELMWIAAALTTRIIKSQTMNRFDE